MFKSMKKFYEHKRSYDFGDFDSQKGRKITKKRSHKRLRKQDVMLKEEYYDSSNSSSR